MTTQLDPYQSKSILIKKEDLYAWIESYKKFLCSMIAFPHDHPEHSKAVERSLEYMNVIESMVKRIDELEDMANQLSAINSDLASKLISHSNTIDL
jgi:hypothetical protein